MENFENVNPLPGQWGSKENAKEGFIDTWTQWGNDENTLSLNDKPLNLKAGDFESMLDWCASPAKQQQRHGRRGHHSTRPAKTSNLPCYSRVRRLAQKGGVQRIARHSLDEARETLVAEFLKPILEDAVKQAEYANRKTIGEMDIVRSLKRNGVTLYGRIE